MANSVDLENLSASVNGSDAQPERAQPLSEAQLLAQASAPAAQADPVPVDAGSGQPVQAAQPTAAAPAQVTPGEFTADASNVVHLPANISVDNIKVDGKNLILVQADGAEIVIKDAASNVPTFMLGDVELPRVALIAALEAGGVDVAFGPDGSISVGPGSANSSGGNFELPAGGIGNGFDLSALLPPTALQFPQYEYRELYAGLEERDTEPTIDVGTGFFVDEEALSDGSNPASDAEQASGTFNITSGNDIGSLVINGVDVTNGGQVAGTYGTLTVTGDPLSGYSWTYVLNDNTLDHLDSASTGTSEGIFDSFNVVVTDTDGDPASATLNIDVLDDGPTLSVQANAESSGALSIELDETVGPDRYDTGEAENGTNSNTDDAAPALAQATTALGGGLASLFVVGGVYGADGQGQTVGAFSFTGIPDTGLATNLTATDGGAIKLFLVGGEIVGQDEQNNVVLKIAIVGAPGSEQLQTTLYEALNHGADGNKFDSSKILSLTEGNKIELQYEVTRTDGDGDSITQTATVPLADSQGSSFVFDDDGPSLTVAANEGAAAQLATELDETVGADRYNTGEAESGTNNNTDDISGALAQVSSNVTGGLTQLFTIGGDFGSDGPGKVTGSLSFTGIPDTGLATNLTATDGGAIKLFLVGGEIVGQDEQNNVVLKIAIVGAPGSEQLQTTLYEALNHGADGNKFDSSKILSLTEGNKIELQYEVTRTDGDGDSITQTATVPLADSQGSSFVFDDDGPSLTVAANEGAAAQLATELDETVGADRYNTGEAESGTNNNTDDISGALAQVSSNVTGGLTQLFTIGGDFGSDGPGKVTGSLSFTGIPDTGLATNLTAKDGGAIKLFLVGGEIVGQDEQNNVVLKIAIVGAPGSEQLQTTLYEALNHGADGNKFDSSKILSLTEGNKIELQYEVTRTDGDGDSITQTATVPLADSQGSSFVFDDDGPKLVGAAKIVATVDEDGLGNTQSTGNADASNPGEVTGTNLAVATGDAGALLTLVDFGQDGPHPTTAFGVVVQATPVDSGFSSKGSDVVIVSDGTTLTGYVNVGGGAGYDSGTDRAVFTLTVGGDGSYVFTLIDQIDHPSLNGLTGDDTENLLTNDGIDLSSFVVAMDGDGDTIGLGAGAFQVQVLDDIPTIVARDAGSTTTTTTETIVYTLQAGNTDVRGMDGSGNHDIKLSGIDINEGDNSVNTTGTKIGIGDGQIIDGYETHPKTSGPEILTMDFVNNLTVTPYSDGGSYDVSSVSFTIDVAEAHGIEDAILFIGAKDGGAFEAIVVKVNGVAVAGIPVFEGGVQVGYAFDNVPDGATIEVVGSTPFDQLRVGNYSGFTFDSTAGGADTTLTGGNSFKIYGIEAKVTTTTTVTEVFRVSHDESAGANTGSDPNPANDVDPLVNTPPALIQDPAALGYAKSAASVLTLFNDVSVGADENGIVAFSVTDANGNAIVNLDSGLKTLGGAAIMLSTDANGVLVGKAGADTVFKVDVDGAGSVWIAQYQPIAHSVDGTSSAALDDIATIAANLHVKATVTDFDGDTTTAVSKVALAIDFQDDGPVAHNDQNSVTEDGPVSASGNVVTGAPGADDTGTDGFGSIAWDGAAGTVVAGTYGQLTVGTDGGYIYTLYTQAQNPAAYAAVQGLSNNETLSESFDYTLTDGDGDSSLANLTITINGADDGVTIGGLTPSANGGDAVVDEKGLPPRAGDPAGSGEVSPNPNDNSDNSETTTGNFTFTSPDGLQTLTIAGTAITYAQLAASGGTPITISGGPAYGTLVINGFTGTQAGGTVQYRFTLTDNLATHTDTDPSGDGDSDRGIADQLFADYTISVTDTDGSSAPGTLSIAINDDGPTANNDGPVTPAEDTAVTFSVVGNDVFGADGVNLATGVVKATDPTKGTAVYNGDGTFTYTPTAGQTGSDSFTYTITDKDGDTSTATVTITLAADSAPSVTSTTNLVVDEDGFANAAVDTSTVRADETDSTESLTQSGTAVVNFGNDVPTNLAASIALVDTAGLDGQLQTLAGNAVNFGLEGGALVGRDSVTNAEVIRIAVTGAVSGPGAGDVTYSYSTTLSQPLKHAAGAVENSAVLSGVTFQATDKDGDPVQGSFSVTVVDDVPQANADGPVTPAEDTAVTFSVVGNDVFGADGVNLATGVVKATDPTKGTAVYNGDGTFTYTPTAGQTGSDSFTYTITDKDGDTSTATVTITLAADSAPSVTSTTNLVVDEDGFANAAVDTSTVRADETDSTESLTQSGTAVVNFGNDVPTNLAASIALVDTAGLDGQLQTLAGNAVNFGLEGGALVGRDSVTNAEVIRIAVTGAVSGPGAGDVTYSYSTTLSQPLKHAAGAVENSAVLSGVTFQATDKDGDPVQGSFSVTVVDDVPQANADGPVTPAEDTAVTFSVVGNDVFGADGVNLATGVVKATDPTKGTAVYNGDGTFTYTPTAGQTGSDSFTYTITDKDGDTSTATVTITLAADSAPSVTSTTNLVVDEDGFANAAVDTSTVRADETDSTESLTQSGTAVVNFGNDVPINLAASIALVDTAGLDGQLQTLAGNAVNFGLEGGALVGRDSVTNAEVIRIAVTGAVSGPGAGDVTYSYSTTLSQPLKHAAGAVENSAVLSGVTFQATDKDGDPVQGSFSVTVVDDVPQANADGPVTPAEDTAVTFSVVGNDVFGADGVNLATGVVKATDPTKGTAVYNGDGTFTYTPTAGQTGSDSFTYTITDKDGDTSTATVTITLAADSAPSVTSTTNLVVDEDGFANAAVDTSTVRADETDSTESLTQSGTAVVNFGNDVPTNLAASIALVDTAGLDGQLQTLAGNAVNFGLEGGALVGRDSVTNAEVIRIAVTGAVSGPDAGDVTYSYSTTLSQPLKHAAGAVENSAVLSGVTFQATDKDGDPVQGSFSVTVVDDVPQANADGPVTPAEDTAVTFSVVGNDVFGADGVNLATGVVKATDPTKGTAVYNGDGTFTYTPTAGQTGSDSFTYTITDKDGDTSTATVTITLAADSAPSVTSTTNLVVDEDGFANAAVDTSTVRADETDSTESLTQSGTAVVNFGNDVPTNLAASIALVDTAGLDGQLQTLAGNAVNFGLEGGALVGRDSVTNAEVIRIAVTGAVSGPGAGDVTYSYSTTLSQPLKHAAGAVENSAVLSGVTFQATDKDGDPVQGSFSVTVVDDVPQANADGPVTPAEDTAVTFSVVGNDVFGADGVNLATGVVKATDPTKGTAVYNGDGTFTYTPTAGQTGSDSFTYTITDKDGDTSTATVTITLAADSAPSVTSTTNLVVDEDGFANAAVDTSTVRADETDSTESLTQSGTAVVNFGNDVPTNLAASIALVDTAGLDGQLQTLAGNAVNFGLEGGALVGRDSVTNAEVIRIAVTGAVSGPGAGDVTYSYSTTLSQPLKHAAGAVENSAVLSGVTFQATDKDGDPVQGSFSVTVVDDVPQANADGPVTPAEDTAVTFSVVGNDVFGADGVNLATGVVKATDPTKGTAVYNGDGTFTYTPTAGQTGSDSFTYTITDKDGDTSTATVTITLAADSAPSVTSTTNLVVDEDGFANAAVDTSTVRADETDSTESLTQSGTAVVNFGNDVPTNLAASIALVDTAGLDGQLQTLAGNAVNFGLEGGALVGRDSVTNAEVIRIAVTGAVSGPGAGDVTYSYSTTLSQPLKHAAGAVENSAVLSGVTFQATDKDGDPVQGSFSVTVVDDVPQANADGPVTPAEDTAVTFSVVGNDVFGADGVNLATGVVKATDPTKGTAVYNGDGTFTYTPTAGQTGSDSFTYTITDKDGDTSTATVTITLAADSAPSVTSTTNLVVDEDGFANAAVDTSTVRADETDSTESLTQSGTAVVNFGNDVPTNLAASIALVDTAGLDGQLQTLAGNAVNFGLEGGALVGRDSVTNAEVIRIAVTGAVSGPGAGDVTYSYSTTLSQPLKHAAGAVENSAVLSGVTFQATDKDGDPVQGSFSVTVVDDVPQANADGPVTPAEDTAVTFSVVGNDVFGADGVNLATGVVKATDPTKGTAVYNGDGTFTYTPTAGQTGSDSFTYTITDKDGDTSTATVTITLAADSAPSVTSTTNLVVDEDGFANAAVDTSTVRADETDSTESLTQSGTAVVNFGNDVPTNLAASIALVDTAGLDGQLQTLAGNAVNFGLEGGALVGRDSVTNAEVIRIAVTGAVSGPGAGDVTYSYSTTLSQPLKHAAGAVENSAVLSGVTFQATDKDGDPVQGSFSVTVVDDVPQANADGPVTPAEDTAVTFSVVGNDVFGADGVNLATGVVKATDPTKGTAVYNGDGTFTYTPTAGQTGSDSFTYTITDKDGDTSTATVTITLAADSAPSVTSTTNLVVDEDGFANAAVDTSTVRADETDSTESLTQSGTAVVNFGNDVPASTLRLRSRWSTRPAWTDSCRRWPAMQ
jgi:VCBS repeat-containing protein